MVFQERVSKEHRPEEVPLWRFFHLGPDRTTEKQLHTDHRQSSVWGTGGANTQWEQWGVGGLTLEFPGSGVGQFLLRSSSAPPGWTEVSQDSDESGKIHRFLAEGGREVGPDCWFFNLTFSFNVHTT